MRPLAFLLPLLTLAAVPTAASQPTLDVTVNGRAASQATEDAPVLLGDGENITVEATVLGPVSVADARLRVVAHLGPLQVTLAERQLTGFAAEGRQARYELPPPDGLRLTNRAIPVHAIVEDDAGEVARLMFHVRRAEPTILTWENGLLAAAGAAALLWWHRVARLVGLLAKALSEVDPDGRRGGVRAGLQAVRRHKRRLASHALGSAFVSGLVVAESVQSASRRALDLLDLAVSGVATALAALVVLAFLQGWSAWRRRERQQARLPMEPA